MKKYFDLVAIISGCAIIYLWFSVFTNTDFVSIRDNKFSLDGHFFYPVTLNYIAALKTDGSELWPCNGDDYDTDTLHVATTKDSCLMKLSADMDLIKELGFNTVRFTGIGEETINEQNGRLSIWPRRGRTPEYFALSSDKDYKRYFTALHCLFNIANKAGLKAILLIRMRPDKKSTEDFLRRLASQFKNETTLMAYDLFNEPLYFDVPGRSKQDVYNITMKWKKLMDNNAPNQLCTIGLEGIREVFKWDPNILNVDFVSLHPYEYEPEQVRNEIYWYGNYIKKPWMLGETSVPADGDSVPYSVQTQFANKTLKQAANCGAAGYSWWQYKEVNWFIFHSAYMGVVNLKGQTTTKTNKIIHGTVKPVAEEFKSYTYTINKDSCLCLQNYYNYSQNKAFRLAGHLYDSNNKPIEGGVVMAWNLDWTHSYHTVSKVNGSFELYSDFPFYHWIASATLYSVVSEHISPDTAKTYLDNIPTINLGDLKLNVVNLY